MSHTRMVTLAFVLLLELSPLLVFDSSHLFIFFILSSQADDVR